MSDTAGTGAPLTGLETVLEQADGDASAFADGLFSFARLIDTRPSVRRALTDTGRSAGDREGLVRRLVGGQVGDAVADVLAACVRERWAKAGDLTDAIERLGVLSQLLAARSAGRLPDVEEDLFRFGRIVQGDRALRAALTDRAAPGDSRRQLVRRLLDGKVAPETITLVDHAVLDRRDRSLEAELERIGDAAARLRERRVAVVRVAAPLSDAHRDRLERVLTARTGAPVQLNVVVEPGLVGGIAVQIGDETVDGTVLSRLDAAGRLLAAGR